MSIRRKNTTHDLATLRLHPDGSRVQQSSVNARRRTAKTTIVDHRGNWIARDAGGRSSVKKRINKHTDGAEGEFVDLSNDGTDRKDASHRPKGKRRARDSEISEEDSPQEPQLERLEERTRRRIAFPNDFSFLDPAPTAVSSLEKDSDYAISFPDPPSDLLKSIHYFASCYYRDRGQLSSSGYHRGKNHRDKEPQRDIQTLGSESHKRWNMGSDDELSGATDETSEEDEDDSDTMDIEDSGSDAPAAEGDTYVKDMYRALDGSALMAIGIVLQEYVAHTLSLSSRSRGSKRRRTG